MEALYRPLPRVHQLLFRHGVELQHTGYLHTSVLGQINSGPPAQTGPSGSTFAVTALSGNPNITISNLAYVPNDSANPTNDQNPNSIYGDITVDYGPDGASGARLQLSVNGVSIMKGLISITYTGPVALPATTTAINNTADLTSASAESVTLSAGVSSSAGPVNGGNVTFSVLNGSGQVVGTPVRRPVVNGIASAMFTIPAGLAAGAYVLDGSYSGYAGGSISAGTRVTLP